MKTDPFLWVSLAAGSIAKGEGRLEDVEYVRKLAYAMYEAMNKVRKEK